MDVVVVINDKFQSSISVKSGSWLMWSLLGVVKGLIDPLRQTSVLVKPGDLPRKESTTIVEAGWVARTTGEPIAGMMTSDW